MDAIEKRARELLAAELAKDGNHPAAEAIRGGVSTYGVRLQLAAVRAIIAALTPPEGYVLVPAEPTQEMLNAGYGFESGYPVDPFLYRAMLAVRPEVKP